jgi:mono/diheme cytochrome c family protein
VNEEFDSSVAAREAQSRCAALLLKLAGLGLLASIAFSAGPVRAGDHDRARIERGRYLVKISGCNDCHTNGYAESGGAVPESQWLTGLPVGFEGPWGVSYPANLRLTMQRLTEQQWLATARAQRLPPMPWFALRDMSDDDLRALYMYVRSLGPAGEPMPAAVPPGRMASTPVIVFVPTRPGNVQAQRAVIDAGR